METVTGPGSSVSDGVCVCVCVCVCVYVCVSVVSHIWGGQ